MIDASGEEEGDSVDEGKEAQPPAECPAAHKPALKTPKGAMTDAEVYANSLGFLGAGNETTAVTLAFVSYEMAIHPEIQEKLQSEIDDYFEDKPVSDSYIIIVRMCCNSEDFHAFNNYTYIFKFAPAVRLLPLAILFDTSSEKGVWLVFRYM